MLVKKIWGKNIWVNLSEHILGAATGRLRRVGSSAGVVSFGQGSWCHLGPRWAISGPWAEATRVPFGAHTQPSWKLCWVMLGMFVFLGTACSFACAMFCPRILVPSWAMWATSWSFVGAILGQTSWVMWGQRRAAVGYVAPPLEVNFGLRRAMLQLPQQNDGFLWPFWTHVGPIMRSFEPFRGHVEELTLETLSPMASEVASLSLRLPGTGDPWRGLCWPILRLWWDYVGPSWRILDHVGAKLAYLRAMLDLCEPHPGVKFGHFEVMLRPCGLILSHVDFWIELVSENWPGRSGLRGSRKRFPRGRKRGRRRCAVPP